MVYFYIISSVIFVTYFILEYSSIKKITNSIPIRILVNGTRGKSTTVQIIHKIFSCSGYKVYGKTTGDRPVLISPDSEISEIKRFSPASILENIRILKNIAKEKPDVMVLECMALQPETQSMLSKIFRPNHIIITNILNDHQEVMGRNLKENIISMSKCIFSKARIYVNDRVYKNLSQFRKLNSNIIVLPEIRGNFGYKNIPNDIIIDSWSIIRGFCSQLSIDKSISQKVFSDEWENIDNNIKRDIVVNNSSIYNLFSVNDIETTSKFVSFINQNTFEKRKKIFFLNCRMERPIRTVIFVKYLLKSFNNSEIWLTGNGQKLAKQFLKGKNNVYLKSSFEAIVSFKSLHNRDTNFYFLGNYKGMKDFLINLNGLYSL